MGRACGRRRTGPDLALLGRLLDDDLRWCVSSHSPPTTLEQAREAIGS
ncbi:hypothetical protein [Micromonospora deserti]|nr:hypothetical protein [Micromonospora deserti]